MRSLPRPGYREAAGEVDIGADDKSPPQLTSLSGTDGPAWSGNDRGVIPGVAEADLTLLADAPTQSGAPRARLEPGIVAAFVGDPGEGPCEEISFCLAYWGPRYTTPEHKHAGHDLWGSLSITGASQPEDGTEVEVAVGKFDPAKGRSVVVSWVGRSDDSLYVAHFEPVRRDDGEVTGFQASGTPLRIDAVRNDPNVGMTHGRLAVGDFLGAGHDQVAVAWADDQASNSAQADVALLEADPVTGLSRTATAPGSVATPSISAAATRGASTR